jgi:hypothetical protein
MAQQTEDKVNFECFGKLINAIDYYNEYKKEHMAQQNEEQKPTLQQNDVIKSVCVSCGQPVKYFDEETNNCCDECWLSASQSVL